MTPVPTRPVHLSDKVSEVLARDERLVEVFARQSPMFTKLRSPGMRRVMARLVTVEQAARICGAEPQTLIHELNAFLGADDDASADAPRERVAPSDDRTDNRSSMSPHDASSAGGPSAGQPRNPWEPGRPVVELDVREDLRKGREPFSRIMAAVGSLRDGEALCLRATFEPVPLFTVMAKRGYDHFAERLDTDDWRVWFYPHDPALADDDGDDLSAAPSTEPEAPAPGASANEIVLDVRGLEPPEPMQRTLEALTDLPDGAVLIQVNVRIPHFLLPILTERGFAYEIHEPSPERVVVRIWRATPEAATRPSAGG